MRRILWKRGMRLTDEILRASDTEKANTMMHAFVLSAAGRFGLMPSVRPFKLGLNLSSESVDIISLSCLAVTKGGDIIDVNYDTFNQHLLIPEAMDADEYILTINANNDTWHPTDEELYEAPTYTFSLLSPDTNIPDHAMPIGHIVNNNGWKLDEDKFVPPCLYLSAHWKYEELQQRFSGILNNIDAKIADSDVSAAGVAIQIFWPLVQQLRIATEKETDLMTPMTLLSNVQKCVSAFSCACDLDKTIELEDAKKFHEYIKAPYNYKDAYQRICVGLELCFSISLKIEILKERRQAPPKEPKAPTISKENQIIVCNSAKTQIPISYAVPGAIIYYTIDGKEPTNQSNSVSDATSSGYIIEFENGFGKKNGQEPDRTVLIKLKAVAQGTSSATATYKIVLRKSLNFRDVDFDI